VLSCVISSTGVKAMCIGTCHSWLFYLLQSFMEANTIRQYAAAAVILASGRDHMAVVPRLSEIVLTGRRQHRDAVPKLTGE
jgi:hypothetical protein